MENNDGQTPGQEIDFEKLWNEEALSRDKGEEEAPAAAAEEKTPEPEETPPQEEPQPAPEPANEILTKFEELQRSHAELLQHVKSAEGRVAAMQREMDLAKRAAAATGDAPSDRAITAAGKSPEKWETLKRDFPEWGEAVEELLSFDRQRNVQSAHTSPDPELVKQAIKELGYASKDEVAVIVEKVRIDTKHDGWEDLVKTEQFSKWYETQPDEVKALGASDHAKDAIAILDKFKAAQQVAGKTQQARAGRLEAAAQTPRRSAPPARSSAELTPQELWDLEAKAGEKRRREANY